MYPADNLSTISHVAHGFFTREGGVSDGLYASLNCGPGSGDAGENVITNQERVQTALQARHLCTLAQIHSAQVVQVTQPWNMADRPEGDALVTNQPGIALGILTADCAPVLFADRNVKVVGAAHAGWKGAFSGMIEETVAAMEALGAERKSIVAAIGPSIAQASYEVGEEFYERFMEADKENGRFFKPSPAGRNRLIKYHFNLPAYVRYRLENAGITDINVIEQDTCSEERRFFSYRRATLRGEVDYGRQISCIMLCNEC